MKADCSGDPSLNEVIRRARGAYLAELTMQEYSLPLVMELLQVPADRSRHPIAQVVFATDSLMDGSVSEFSLGTALTVEACGDPDVSTRFDMYVALQTGRGSAQGWLLLYADIFPEASQITESLSTWIERVIQHPDEPLGRIGRSAATADSQLDE